MGGELAAEIKSFALDELGFDLVGITTAEPLAGSAHLRRWVADGMHGEMAYMARGVDTRCAPAEFLRGARAVICAALSYHDAPEKAELAPNRDRVVVARYGRRNDYHKVIKRRLVRLGRFLAQRRPGARWRTAVDTAPVLERELAQRAGLGWIGKNTCLINRNAGSELLLGEIVTDIALPPDEPATDRCRTCTLCLQACPTQAFVAPHTLDARRCIAYLTIEHRTALPDDLRKRLGAHLFGCDVCQAVCPFNFAPTVAASPLLPLRPALGRLRLPQLRRLDEPGWFELSAGTPLRRLSFARFRRNLDAVVRNIGADDGASGT